MTLAGGGATVAVDGSLAAVTAPPDATSTTASLTASVGSYGPLVVVAGSAVSSSATSSATRSRGASSIVDAVVQVPGLTGTSALLTASSLNAEAICPTDRTAPTTASVGLPATVTVAGTTATVNATGVVVVAVTTGGATGSVSLDFDTRVVTTDTAAATALVVTANVDVPSVGATVGTITLAQAACQRPAVPAPTALSLNPTSGPTSGGQTVTVTGGNFVPGATTVTIGGVVIPAAAVSVATGGSTLTFTTPARETAGPVNVVTTTAAGSTPPLIYTYVAPTLTTVAPASGPTSGGTTVTLTGSGFTGATGATFDGASATGATVVSDSTITLTTPAGAAGTADVVVVLPGGDAIKVAGFTYAVAPKASSITPDAGPTEGGQTVTITGSGFTAGATTVTFDGVAAARVTIMNARELRAATPPGTAGPATVVVATAGGSTVPLDYTYAAAPVFTSLNPASGPAAGGQPITVAGSGFIAGQTTVRVGDTRVPAADVSVAADGNSLVFLTPTTAAGALQVTITTPGGTSTSLVYAAETAVMNASLANTGAQQLVPIAVAGLLALLVGAALFLTGAALPVRKSLCC